MMTLFAFALPMLILFCGLTIDIGRTELLKTQMQSASDAAAIGAELESERGVPGGSLGSVGGSWDWVAQGKQDAAVNGFTDGSNGVTVSIAQNPTSGSYAGRYDAIQVTISKTYNTIFMGALHGGTWTLTTQSVALVPPCSYFLGGASPHYNYTFYVASAWLNATCPVYINNNYEADVFGRLWGFGVDVSGSAGNSAPLGWETQKSEGPASPGNPSSILPTYGTPAMTDPLLNVVTQPTFSSCTYTSKTITTGTATLSPGTYCGTSSTIGLRIQHATVTLNPGLYIVTGGAQIDFSTVNGTGVTLFFTNGNGAQYGQLQVGDIAGGQSVINLSAPTSNVNGGIPGILFFADRNWVSTSSMDFNFGTYGTFNGDGIWYLPNTGLYIWLSSGGFTVPNYGSFVVRNTYYFGTNVNSSQNYSSISGGSPFRTQSVLVQ